MTATAIARIEVLLITYNHEPYVGRALEGVAAQIIDEPLRLVVADDSSTDETMAVVHAFAKDHPDIEVVFLDNSSNRGVTRNYERAFASCTGTYVAVLEGDDYWVSPHKLARQRDFLDVRLECDLCSVNYYVFEEGRGQFTPRWQPGDGHMLLGARELIADNVVGNFSTCMYRTRALQALPPAVFGHKSYDWIMNILLARTSLIAFLHEPMSVYRIHGDGVWSVLSRVEKLKAQRELIPTYNELTNGVFSYEFTELDRRLRHVIEEASDDSSQGSTSPVLGLAETRLRVRDWFPPILIPVARALIPNAVKRMIGKVRGGER
jgi:glycosyltransferase involved in cell wall biosynthesis